MPSFGAVWGIDVGDSALKAVKLKRAGKQISLLDFQIVRYSDISGEAGARREGVLAQAVAALQAAGLGSERCIVSIAPQLVFNRFISLPPVDRRRIPEIVLYEARQQIPFNLNEVVWGYEVLRKEFIPGEEIDVGLFAAKREVIDAYLAELAPLWKGLHAIQHGPLGLYNFICHEVALTRPTVVVDIGSQSTNFLILDGQRFWTRNLPIAGNSFTTILEKRLNISRAEAEKLKFTVAESRHRRRLLEVLRPVMRDLVAEIQRSIGYYKSLSQAVKFEEILVTGEGYKLFGLDRFLAEQLQYQITPIVELKNIVYEGDPERAKNLGSALPSLGVAIGLGLQGLGRARATINLLPEDFIVRRELRAKRYTGLIAAALIWGIVGCFWMKEKSALEKLSKEEDAGKVTLGQVETLSRKLNEAKQGDDPARLKLYRNYGTHREFPARVVDGIAAVIPREFEVGEFKITPQGLGVAPGGAPLSAATPSPRTGETPSAAEEANAAEAKGVAESSLVLTFTATCPGDKEPTELTVELPKSLKKARIYPERIDLVKGVLIARPNSVKDENRAGGEVVRGRPETATREASPYGVAKWTTTVTIGLIGPSVVDDLIKKAQEDAKEKAEQEAKAAAEAAAAAAAAAASPAPAAPARTH